MPDEQTERDPAEIAAGLHWSLLRELRNADPDRWLSRKRPGWWRLALDGLAVISMCGGRFALTRTPLGERVIQAKDGSGGHDA